MLKKSCNGGAEIGDLAWTSPCLIGLQVNLVCTEFRCRQRLSQAPRGRHCAQRDADFETISASPLEDRPDERIQTEQVCPTA
jgi:hypothetical protein